MGSTWSGETKWLCLQAIQPDEEHFKLRLAQERGDYLQSSEEVEEQDGKQSKAMQRGQERNSI